MHTDLERWYDYLYERHSRAELAGSARSLSYFRYCRAYGGHANDGDSLKVQFRHGSEAELRRQFETLGMPLLAMPRLQPLADDIVDPPQDNDHCICPKYYPDIWY